MSLLLAGGNQKLLLHGLANCSLATFLYGMIVMIILVMFVDVPVAPLDAVSLTAILLYNALLLAHWLTNRLTDWLNYRLTYWLTDWLAHRLTNWGSLADRHTYGLFLALDLLCITAPILILMTLVVPVSDSWVTSLCECDECDKLFHLKSANLSGVIY